MATTFLSIKKLFIDIIIKHFGGLMASESKFEISMFDIDNQQSFDADNFSPCGEFHVVFKIQFFNFELKQDLKWANSFEAFDVMGAIGEKVAADFDEYLKINKNKIIETLERQKNWAQELRSQMIFF